MTAVGGMSLPLSVAKEKYDTLPKPGEILNVNGDEHIVIGCTITEDIEREQIELVIKLKKKRELRIAPQYSTEQELREAAGHLLE